KPIKNPPTIQPAEFSTQSQPERQKPDQTKTSNTQTQRPERHKNKSSHNPKTWTHDAKIWHQTILSIHYRVLKEHTPTSATPHGEAHSSKLVFGFC
ncbi:hypothetical protein, partial [Gordonia sputi]|uniref:hypothetical protein n=1 Tax=Gordonia sputi TaxID=36823 RepID=UPI001C3F225C